MPVDQELARLPVAQHHERRRPAEDCHPRLAGPPPYAYGDGAVRCAEVDGGQESGPGLLVAPESGGHREVPSARRGRQVLGGYGDRYPAPDQGSARVGAVRIEDQQLARPVVHTGEQIVREGEEPRVLGEMPVVECGPLVAVGEVQQAYPARDLVGHQEAGRQVGRVGHGDLLRTVGGVQRCGGKPWPALLEMIIMCKVPLCGGDGSRGPAVAPASSPGPYRI